MHVFGHIGETNAYLFIFIFKFVILHERPIPDHTNLFCQIQNLISDIMWHFAGQPWRNLLGPNFPLQYNKLFMMMSCAVIKAQYFEITCIWLKHLHSHYLQHVPLPCYLSIILHLAV